VPLRIEPLASPQLELTDFPLQRSQQIAAVSIARKLAVSDLALIHQ
jgi:hypothetical protein